MRGARASTAGPSSSIPPPVAGTGVGAGALAVGLQCSRRAGRERNGVGAAGARGAGGCALMREHTARCRCIALKYLSTMSDERNTGSASSELSRPPVTHSYRLYSEVLCVLCMDTDTLNSRYKHLQGTELKGVLIPKGAYIKLLGDTRGINSIQWFRLPIKIKNKLTEHNFQQAKS